MKKVLMGLMGLMAMSGSAYVHSSPTTTVTVNESTPTAPVKDLPPVKISATHPLINEKNFPPSWYYNAGRSPKEYGEFLQRNGLQKWTRKK